MPWQGWCWGRGSAVTCRITLNQSLPLSGHGSDPCPEPARDGLTSLAPAGPSSEEEGLETYSAFHQPLFLGGPQPQPRSDFLASTASFFSQEQSPPPPDGGCALRATRRALAQSRDSNKERR